jgi:hypothetical protein
MISLKKVSAVVVTCAVAAFYADAKDSVEIGEQAKSPMKKAKAEFVQLVAKYDADNNGLLSKAEVAKSKHKALIKNFDEIDQNDDSGLSEEELKAFNLITKKK